MKRELSTGDQPCRASGLSGRRSRSFRWLIEVTPTIWNESEEPRALGSSYLWRVAHSAVMDQIRSRRRQREETLEDLPERAAPASESPERQRVAAELQYAIDEGLAAMAESRRNAVLLYLLGHGLADSASILGWNTKQVDNHRYRGLAELRRHLRTKGLGP